ncbi:hypothetical protein ACWDSJ_30345 [Nocardia sp. NPDC003482]
MARGTFTYIDTEGTPQTLTNPVDTIAYNVQLWPNTPLTNNTDTTAWLHPEEDGEGPAHPLPPGHQSHPTHVASIIFT